MGEVYRAEDLSLRRHVAIKVLPPRLAGRPEALERFEREASAVGALNHPNIVTIHSIEEIEGQRLISMELVEGETLHTLVPEDGLSVERCLDLAIPLTAAVAAAHRRGVTHRDIKPANIMVGGDDMVKVVDFGLAKLRQVYDEEDMMLSRAGEPTLTREGQVLGTVPYMAPEQFRGLPADHRSDVFALGVVLYEMMTGRHPFPGDTQPLVISSILRDPPRPPDEMRADLPPGLRAIVDRCLEKAPEDRYQDATALHGDLLALKQSIDSDAIIRSVQVDPPAVPWRAIVTVSAVLIALVVGGWLLSRSESVSPVAAGSTGTEVESANPDAVAPVLPRLAVMHFRNTTRNQELDWLCDGLPDMLITDLSQSNALEVVDADRIYSVLNDLGALELDRRPGADLARDVGARTGAALVLSGGFTRLGDRIRIDLHVHDAGTGETLESISREGTGEDSIFSLIDDLSRSVRGSYGETRLVTEPGRDRGVEDVTTSSLEAYRLYVEATKLHRQAKLDAAKSLYEEAIELDPGFSMAYARLIAISVVRADFIEAKRFAQLAFEHADRLPESERLYIEAEFYSARRSTYPRAIAAFETVIARFPDHFIARRSLGHLYGFIEQFENAIDQYLPVFEADAEIPGIANALVHMYASMDFPEHATQIIEAESARLGPDWSALVSRGILLTDQNRFEKALEVFEQAEALRPGDPLTYHLEWSPLVLKGDHEAAILRAQRMIAHDHAALKCQGFIRLGLSALYEGDGKQAIAQFRLAMDTVDGGVLKAIAAGRLSDLLLLVDQPSEVLSVSSRAQAEAPEDWPGWEAIYWEALTHQALGDEEAADVAAAAFASKAPEDDQLSIVERRYTAHLEAQLALARGNTRTARSALERAIMLLPPRGIHWDWVRYPDHPMVWETGARVAEAEGDEAEALLFYKRLADSLVDRHEDPVRWVRSLYHVGRLSEAQGNTVQARRYYQRFVDQWSDGNMDRDFVRAAQRFLAASG